MSKIRLFSINGKKTTEVKGDSVRLERELQVLMENNLEELLGVRFLETEYSTGVQHRGRIDTLGIDQDNCPVIIEYKRYSSESVINQGLYYLNWLLDHKAEYERLVEVKFGSETAKSVEWDQPRIICVAGGFNKYDIHTADVLSASSNIDLMRYIKYDEHLLLEKIHSSDIDVKKQKTSTVIKSSETVAIKEECQTKEKPVMEDLSKQPEELNKIYRELEDYIFTLGDDVTKRIHQRYIAYSRFSNFMTLLFQKNKIVLYLFLDSKNVEFKDNMKDMTSRNSHKIGDVRYDITNRKELERSLAFIEKAYQG